jgi:site-specific DNA recombinase
MTSAALYVRVSTRHQADDGFSLEEQREALTALATERGWSFRLYVDAGISGEKIDNRPGLLDLLTTPPKATSTWSPSSTNHGWLGTN